MKLYHLGSIGLVIGALTLSGCGDHTVGTTTMVFSDTDITQKVSHEMQELLDIEEGDSRDLMVKMWYPTEPEPNEESRFHYGYHTENNDYAVDQEESEEILDFLRENQQQSQSYQNAAPLKDRAFPVIFYSHGYGGQIEENEPYYESLVKKGYIVVSIGHTSEASFVTLNNGKTVPFNENFQEDAFGRERPFVEQDPNLEFTEEDAIELAEIPLGELVPTNLLQRYHTAAYIGIGTQEHLNLWVSDTHFVLSQLEKINKGDIESHLKGAFDLSRIGATGHSYGGATARRFCNEEPNCLASINMDGSSAALFNEKILTPHLQYASDIDATIAEEIRDDDEVADEDLDEIRQELQIEKQNDAHANINAATTDLYLATIASIAHSDFTVGWLDFHDFGLGKIVWNPIITTTSIDFFDTYMKSDIAKKFLCYELETNENIMLDFTNSCD